MDIRNVMKICKENKLLTTVICLLVTLFVAFTVTRCSAVNTPAPASAGEAEAPGEQSEGGEQGEQKPAYADGDLSEEQKSARDGYSDEVRDVIALLKANSWTAAGDTASLTWTGEDYSESSGGNKRTSVPYVATALSGSLDANTETTQAGSTVGRVTVAMETPTGTHLVELTRTTDAKGATSWMVSSDAFTAARSYTRAAATAAFSIEVPDEDKADLEALFKGKLADLEAQMRDYCGLYYPSASKAVWERSAVADWAESTVTTSFKLDNQSHTLVSVVYDASARAFDVGTVR